MKAGSRKRFLWLLAAPLLGVTLRLCLPAASEPASRPRPSEASVKSARPEPASHSQLRAELALHLKRALHEAAVQQAAQGHDDHPHPISAAHQRLYRDLDLLQAADEEIKRGRFDAARALLAEHHRELPGMSAVEEEGLWLLADCAETRNEETVARVQAFYDLNTSSQVRRRLRRACLEL